MTYHVVKYSGPFGFIKPWTAVRDIETYSQQVIMVIQRLVKESTFYNKIKFKDCVCPVYIKGNPLALVFACNVSIVNSKGLVLVHEGKIR